MTKSDFKSYLFEFMSLMAFIPFIFFNLKKSFALIFV